MDRDGEVADATDPAALADLLTRRYSVDELRRWVARTFGRDALAELPGPPVALAELAFQVELMLDRRGWSGRAFAALRADELRDHGASAAERERPPLAADRRRPGGRALAFVLVAAVALTAAVLWFSWGRAPVVDISYLTYNHQSLWVLLQDQRSVVELATEVMASPDDGAGADGWGAFKKIHASAEQDPPAQRQQRYSFVEIQNSGGTAIPRLFIALEGYTEPVMVSGLQPGEKKLLPFKISGKYANLARHQERRIQTIWMDRGAGSEVVHVNDRTNRGMVEISEGVYRGYPE